MIASDAASANPPTQCRDPLRGVEAGRFERCSFAPIPFEMPQFQSVPRPPPDPIPPYVG